MASIDVVSLKKDKVGEIALDAAVFDEKPKVHVVYEEVKRYLAFLRSGTHATKTRGDVAGAGRKLWKQKGTGKARMGSVRSPLWRKGGTTHGPQPHRHELDIPRKVKGLAMRVALSDKVRCKALVVLDALAVGEPKTRAMASIVRDHGWDTPTLIVEDASNRNLYVAARNLRGVKVVAPSALSVYDVVRHPRLVLTRGTAQQLAERFRP